MRKRLRQFLSYNYFTDIKRFIQSPYKFYERRIPEFSTLANKLHDDYSLRKFYTLFDKLWKSGTESERILAIKTLQLYKDDFNLSTWRFLKSKLGEISSFEEAEIFGRIINILIARYPKLKKRIPELFKEKNSFIKIVCFYSTLPSEKSKSLNLTFSLLKQELKNPDPRIQRAIVLIFSEIARIDRKKLEHFISRERSNISESTLQCFYESFSL